MLSHERSPLIIQFNQKERHILRARRLRTSIVQFDILKQIGQGIFAICMLRIAKIFILYYFQLNRSNQLNELTVPYLMHHFLL